MQVPFHFDTRFNKPDTTSVTDHLADAAFKGGMQFPTPLFSFGASSSSGHPATTVPGRDVPHGTHSLLFLDGLDTSLGGGLHAVAATDRPTVNTTAPNSEEIAAFPTAPADLGDTFTKFSAGPNAEGSSGFLSDSAGTATHNPAQASMRSGKGSPMPSTLPLSPCSCASSQPHGFPSSTPSPSAPGYFSMPSGMPAGLGGVSTALSPSMAELAVPTPMTSGYAMNNMFVPLLMPSGGGVAASAVPSGPLPMSAPLTYMDQSLEGRASGKRVEKPTPVAALPPPASASNCLVRRNVYVSGLPSHFRSNDLRELCQPFGRIEASKLCVDTTTNPTKGYGFALFFDESSAAACIVGLNGRQICGRTLQARYADVAATPKPAAPYTGSGSAPAAAGRSTGRVSPANVAHTGNNNNNNNNNNTGSRRQQQQQQQQPPNRNGQGSSVASATSLSPPMMPASLMYTSTPQSAPAAPALPGGMMWLPQQVPSAASSAQYVMLPQGTMPLMVNTAMPLAQAAAPASAVPSMASPGLFYVMDPVTHQVQLCQYPAYMPTHSLDGSRTPPQFGLQ